MPTILLELDPGDGMKVRKTYMYANGEILMQYNGNHTADKYFYLHDRLGSVREIINTNGAVVNHYTYGPFGQTVDESSHEPPATSNCFLFAGQYYDSEIGQYYLRARQYDPQLMRFTGRDPVDGKPYPTLTLHKYIYCLNEPLNSVDPSGKTAWNLVTPILTGYMLHDQAINLGAYGAASGDLRFFDLAELTEGFIPYAIAMSTVSSFMPLWSQITGTMVSLKSYNTGMGASGLIIDGWTGSMYSLLVMAKAKQIGISSSDISDFAEWKGGYFSAVKWWSEPKF